MKADEKRNGQDTEDKAAEEKIYSKQTGEERTLSESPSENANEAPCGCEEESQKRADEIEKAKAQKSACEQTQDAAKLREEKKEDEEKTESPAVAAEKQRVKETQILAVASTKPTERHTPPERK